MMLSLSEPELRELRQALEVHLSRLETELSRTDDRALRRSLRQTYDLLEGIRHRLAQSEELAGAVV